MPQSQLIVMPRFCESNVQYIMLNLANLASNNAPIESRKKEFSISPQKNTRLKDVRSKIYRMNNFTFTYPPSPLLTQPDDIPRNLMCNELNVPQRCTGQDVCECVHMEHVALETTTEIILIDQGRYLTKYLLLKH
ncbi:hypothetical protein NQ315_005439 [Exocentrus adspersus]|uniref:Phlebovirus glycoprotein G2 fusion domain-containing protein n=1 Tax=Exocentrus adspersus TaxID=1586481 RepID=A0AAV8VDC5_9CUCU|nr:hypothetical protein NQ315_005439 [Exocentrus adspersus]